MSTKMPIADLKQHIYDIVGAIYAVHEELGCGLNEHCYQEGLELELAARGIQFERERSFHPTYRGSTMKAEYRLDFLCKGDVVVECKAVTSLNQALRSQLFNYMRLLKVPCGIIANFHPRFAEVERYFFDCDSREILSVNGMPFGRSGASAMSGSMRQQLLESRANPRANESAAPVVGAAKREERQRLSRLS